MEAQRRARAFRSTAARGHARRRATTRSSPSASFSQICGFGEYGFPESHSASFALLVYVSAWIKHYEPAAFLAALLNSQPMGFYSPSVLVQDARRHGVEVRPADVTVSAMGLHARTLQRNGLTRHMHQRGAAGLAHGERPHRSRRTAHRRGAGSAAVRRRARSRAPRFAQSPRSRELSRPPGALAHARGPSAQRALARRRRRQRGAAPACATRRRRRRCRSSKRPAKARTSSPITAASDSRSAATRSRCCAAACSACALRARRS